MLWIKAFHIISMVAWFAGLFYLPRLFVYHAEAEDVLSLQRFEIMERRLYYGIMYPALIATNGLGILLFLNMPVYYVHQPWMHAKLFCVLCLIVYHLYCGYCRKLFVKKQNKHSAVFYRVFNEVPTLFLMMIVCLVVVKPVLISH
ncbi:MAG: protoporphyrinogen oxidase HemJ [Legionellaceae bacterium]|nr:protoporphyrinogen oxidase HemJ [Legionellaceae bacterium]